MTTSWDWSLNSTELAFHEWKKRPLSTPNDTLKEDKLTRSTPKYYKHTLLSNWWQSQNCCFWHTLLKCSLNTIWVNLQTIMSKQMSDRCLSQVLNNIRSAVTDSNGCRIESAYHKMSQQTKGAQQPMLVCWIIVTILSKKKGKQEWQ
jgi:hypothetical protein